MDPKKAKELATQTSRATEEIGKQVSEISALMGSEQDLFS